MKKTDKKRIDRLIGEFTRIVGSAADEDIAGLLGDGVLQRLLDAIAGPKVKEGEAVYEYILRNKHRLQLLALIRLAIHVNCPVKSKVGSNCVFVSPNHVQWFEDGVMFVQGEKQFEGALGLYQRGRVKFAIARRDKRGGETMGLDDVDFVDTRELRKRSKQPSVPKSVCELDAAVSRLQSLLDSQERDERKYQKFLEDNPWFLSAQYKHIQSHEAFDNANVPDFTGTRVRDGARDILEIKQPFLRLFRSDNTFRTEFNCAWNQAERYLDFARREADYLHREKGLIFENPRCFLIIGYGLASAQRREMQRKERMNSAITILSYEDLMAIGRDTVAFIKALKTKGRRQQNRSRR